MNLKTLFNELVIGGRKPKKVVAAAEPEEDPEPMEVDEPVKKKSVAKRPKSKAPGASRKKEEEEDLGEIVVGTAKQKEIRKKEDFKARGRLSREPRPDWRSIRAFNENFKFSHPRPRTPSRSRIPKPLSISCPRIIHKKY